MSAEPLRARRPAPTNAVVTRLSDIAAQPIEWLWPGRLALGMLHVLDGDPGLGKSTILVDVAARLSRGDLMPDGALGPGEAATILFGEDDLSRVVRPRLEAAGARLDQVLVLSLPSAEGLRDPRLVADDIHEVQTAAVEHGAKLIVFDPFMDYLPASVDSHRDQDTRKPLGLLRRLAEETGAAVVAVRHLNKSTGGQAIYRGGGSIAIIGSARIGLLLAADPEAPENSRVLAVMKSNLGSKPPSLKARLIGTSDGASSRVEWLGTSGHTPDSLLAAPETPRRRSAIDEATAFLQEALCSGPLPTREIEAQAEDAGISEKTLARARAKLGVQVQKIGQPGHAGQGWLLSLPDTCEQAPSHATPKDATSDAVGQLRRIGPAAWPSVLHRAEDGQAFGDGRLRIPIAACIHELRVGPLGGNAGAKFMPAKVNAEGGHASDDGHLRDQLRNESADG